MHILLINICIRYDSPVKHIPVGLACIATALKKAGYRPDILDIDLYRYSDAELEESFKKNNNYDLVGFGNIVSGYKYTKKLARQVKKVMPGTVLVVGNTVATSIPELLLKSIPEIDIAAIGEADKTIVELASALAENKSWKSVAGIAYREGQEIVSTQKRKVADDIGEIPFPDYSLFEIEKYLAISAQTVSEPLPPIPQEKIRALPLNTARGCPFNCTFCYHAFKGEKYRYYPFKMVIAYIKCLQERFRINYVNFWDELTFFSPGRLQELCDNIEKERVSFYWGITTRPDVFRDKDLSLLKRSRELGALFIGGAFESANSQILAAMQKRISIQRYIEQVEVARRAGLGVATSIVIGYPQETPQTINETFSLCRQVRIYPSVGFLLPLPGTPMYDYARQNNLIKEEGEYLSRIGDRQDLHINLTQMSDAELVHTVKEHLISLKDELKIPLSDESVIKTGYSRISKR